MTDQLTELTGAETIAWNLGDLYAGPTDPALTHDLDACDRRAEVFSTTYRGKIGTLDAETLLTAIQEYEAMAELMNKVASYAHLLWSTNTNEPTYGALLQKITERTSKIGQALLFFGLEWIAVPDNRAIKLMSDPLLEHYQHYLNADRRYRPYVLSEAEEKILAEKEVTGTAAWNRFFDETLSAARYDLNGQQVSQEQVLKQMYSPDRTARKTAQESMTAGLRGTLRTTTYIYNTILADKASDDALRKYPSWISARNLSNKAKDETVQALIDAVTSRYDLVARYYTLKRELLGLGELFDYDRYAPLPFATAEKFQWEEARNIVLIAYGRFHPRMAEIADMFFEKKWIDAPVRPGKRGGAYSAGVVPSVHPYVFLNYIGTARDISTLAHELGHGVHQYLSRGQGMLQAHTPLTTAEMASTFGEKLTFDDLLARLTDPKARLALLAGKIEDTFATVFRQVSMNRFEDAMHTARRTEGELSSERFGELWMKTQRAMFGDSVTLTDNYSVWWSYIPHFLHTPGYVYAYSFGELLVQALFARYRQEGDAFSSKYLDVLAAGGSDWPHVLLNKVGVDLTQANFWTQGLSEVETMVTQAETLAKEIKETGDAAVPSI